VTGGPFDAAGSLVVHNPVSGRAPGRRRASRLVAELVRRGYPAAPTGGPGEAATIAARAARHGLRSVIVVGGDGTLFEAIAELPPEVAIAQFPTGTVNLFARSLAIPTDESRWLSLFEERATQRVFFARCNDRPFASVASVGFDALVVARVSRRLKKWIQEGAYAVRALYDLPRYRFPSLAVRVDGDLVPETLVGVLIGKGPHFGGPHRVLPSADPLEPTLAVTTLAGHRRIDLLRYARGFLFGTLPRLHGVSARVAREVVIEATPAAHVELDGEACGGTPARFDVEPSPRLVLAPSPQVD